MIDYNLLKSQIRSLNDQNIRLSADLDNLLKQEQQELNNLKQLGVTDLDAAIVATSSEVTLLKQQVEQNFAALATLPQ